MMILDFETWEDVETAYRDNKISVDEFIDLLSWFNLL